MNLYSFAFGIFIVITLLCYYTVFKKQQWICLLVASMVFYAYEGIVSFFFIFVTAISTWLGALIFAKLDQKSGDDEKKTIWYRRIIFWSVIALNFGILAYLKYWNVIFHTSKGLLLPLGISFYIFQSMSYLIDTYNRKYEAQKNPAKFLLFVSFFPQLIQGPINRYDELGKQLYKVHEFQKENLKRGIYLFAFGMMKKYAIANILYDMVAQILDSDHVVEFPGSVIAFGILLFAIYQYADFSGGIDMVMGVAKIFDIQMLQNFRQPYFATSLADFWRRWHISLGRWMKDYVFFPFTLTAPMKRLGKWAKKHMNMYVGRVLPAVISNILVFFLVGIWHGAEIHYVAWGLYNGIIIGLSDLLAPIFNKCNNALHIKTKSKGMHIFRIIRTFFIVNIGGFFDRIYDFKLSIILLKNTFFHFGGRMFLDTWNGIVQNEYSMMVYLVVLLAIIFVFVISVQKERKNDIYVMLHQKNVVFRFIVYYFVIFLTLIAVVCTKSSVGFMYENF